MSMTTETRESLAEDLLERAESSEAPRSISSGAQPSTGSVQERIERLRSDQEGEVVLAECGGNYGAWGN